MNLVVFVLIASGTFTIYILMLLSALSALAGYTYIKKLRSQLIFSYTITNITASYSYIIFHSGYSSAGIAFGFKSKFACTCESKPSISKVNHMIPVLSGLII